jgi:hypothetical protein
MSRKRSDSKNTDRARRRLLQSLAAGGGAWASKVVLPEQWRRPVVDVLSLPAHAQTTGDVMNGTSTVEIEVDVVQADPLLDALVPQGLAAPLLFLGVTFECCCNVTPDGDGYHADASFMATFGGTDDDISQDADTFNEDCILLGSGHVDSQFRTIHIHCGDRGPFDFALRIEGGLGQFGIRFNGVDYLSSVFPLLPDFKDLHAGECCKFELP